jgi:hypothetical protein
MSLPTISAASLIQPNVLSFTTSARSTILTNLTDNTYYICKVSAVNAQGYKSPYINTTFFRGTNPAIPTINTITRGNVAATIIWGLSSSSGAISVTYTYSYNNNVTPLIVYTGTAPATPSGPQTLTVTNTSQTPLLNGQTYTFRIIATNDQGLTATSSSQQVTPATNPSAPGLASTARVGGGTITWTPSASSGANSIVSYTYSYYNSTINGPTTSGTAIIGTQTIQLTGLVSSNQYRFTMTATNDQGLSASSITSFISL